MRSTMLLYVVVLCSLCLLVASFPGPTEMRKKEIGDAFTTKVERALDTLDEVFRNVKHLEGPERRDFWGDAWDNVKNYWDENKEQIISTAVDLVLGGVKRNLPGSDRHRPFGGALE